MRFLTLPISYSVSKSGIASKYKVRKNKSGRGIPSFFLFSPNMKISITYPLPLHIPIKKEVRK